MDFQQSIKICFQKYSTFDGRASRSEFWWFGLFLLLVSIAATLLDFVMFSGLALEIGLISTLFSLATILPCLSVTSRRLHDVNRSGWWQLLWFLPVIGWIVVLYWVVKKGDSGANRFGNDPL